MCRLIRPASSYSLANRVPLGRRFIAFAMKSGHDVLKHTLPGRQPTNVTRLRSCRFEYPVKKPEPRSWDEMHSIRARKPLTTKDTRSTRKRSLRAGCGTQRNGEIALVGKIL